MSATAIVLALVAAATRTHAQQRLQPAAGAILRLRVVHAAAEGDTLPVERAAVRAGRLARLTDPQGLTELRLAAGGHLITVGHIGFVPETLTVKLAAGVDTTLRVWLEERSTELEAVIVTATRSERRIEDEPVRVEVLGEDEVNEKLDMTPGDITMMLNETPGLRVQTTSPSLGGANVRVQGLRGRYTQILSDGLPLYGGQTGGLGLLQIPPMDLGGVEIVKGVASALYGGSALGGVINLLSRRPGLRPVREVLANQTTLGGTDVVGFDGRLLGTDWGYTLLAGVHRQSQRDRDGDGWTDLPGYRRAVAPCDPRPPPRRALGPSAPQHRGLFRGRRGAPSSTSARRAYCVLASSFPISSWECDSSPWASAASRGASTEARRRWRTAPSRSPRARNVSPR